MKNWTIFLVLKILSTKKRSEQSKFIWLTGCLTCRLSNYWMTYWFDFDPRNNEMSPYIYSVGWTKMTNTTSALHYGFRFSPSEAILSLIDFRACLESPVFGGPQWKWNDPNCFRSMVNVDVGWRWLPSMHAQVCKNNFACILAAYTSSCVWICSVILYAQLHLYRKFGAESFENWCGCVPLTVLCSVNLDFSQDLLHQS